MKILLLSLFFSSTVVAETFIPPVEAATKESKKETSKKLRENSKDAASARVPITKEARDESIREVGRNPKKY